MKITTDSLISLKKEAACQSEYEIKNINQKNVREIYSRYIGTSLNCPIIGFIGNYFQLM